MGAVKKGYRFVLASVVAFGVAPGLDAQEPPDTTVRLDPVVVTAERIPTARASTPATVTVLTGEELEARGVRSIADALRDVTGLEVARTGSFGGSTSAFMRGGESDYVKVLVDGVPVNDPGGAIDLADLTTDNVDRVEIVRGPVSVLYGSDAMSGVVQIFTKRGRGATHGTVGVRVGSYTAVEALGSVAGGTETVDYAITASRASTDGIYAVNNAYRNIVWSGLLRAVPDDRTEATLALRYGDSRYHFPTDATGNVTDENALQHRSRVVAALEVGRYVTPTLEGRLSLALNQVDGGIDDPPDGPGDTLGYFGYNSVQAVSRRSVDLRVNAYGAAETVLTAGVQLEEQRERSATESLSEYGPSTSTFDGERLNVGYYLQLRAAPLAAVHVTVGARLDDNDTFGTFLSYRGGVVWRAAAMTRVRASVGKAFKEPTFYEHFADAPFARGNPDLQPERSLAWEVSIEQRLFHEHLEFGATYFDQSFRDLIQYSLALPNPTDPTYVNVAAADASGLEVEAVLEPGFGVTVRGGYTYLHTRVVDAGFDEGAGATFVEGERLLRRPTHAFSLFVEQRVGSVRVSGTVRYVGDRVDRDFSVFPAEPVILRSYTVVDLAASASVWRGRAGVPSVEVTARAANLFGVDYQEVFGFLTPGRTVLLGVRAGL